MLQNNAPDAGCFRYKTGTTVLVSGLQAGARKTDVQGALGEFGQILRIDLEVGRAYVEFEDERDAEDAIEEMRTGGEIQGRRIRVERSRPKVLGTNTPAHGARGARTVARNSQSLIDADTEHHRRRCYALGAGPAGAERAGGASAARHGKSPAAFTAERSRPGRSRSRSRSRSREPRDKRAEAPAPGSRRPRRGP